MPLRLGAECALSSCTLTISMRTQSDASAPDPQRGRRAAAVTQQVSPRTRAPASDIRPKPLVTKRTRPCRKPNLSSIQDDSDGPSTSSPAWLLSLPEPCLESVLKHCASDLPGVRGLTSLLRCSRATYDALSTAAHEAIDPGCVAAWSSLAEDYNVQLQALC